MEPADELRVMMDILNHPQFRGRTIHKNDLLKLDGKYVSLKFFPLEGYKKCNSPDEQYLYINEHIRFMTRKYLEVCGQLYIIMPQEYRHYGITLIGPTGGFDCGNIDLINKNTGACYDCNLNLLWPIWKMKMPHLYVVETSNIKCHQLETITLFCGIWAPGIFKQRHDKYTIYDYVDNEGIRYAYLTALDDNESPGNTSTSSQIIDCLLSETGKIVNFSHCDNIISR